MKIPESVFNDALLALQNFEGQNLELEAMLEDEEDIEVVIETLWQRALDRVGSPAFKCWGVRLSIKEDAYATCTYQGKTTEHLVGGLLGFMGSWQINDYTWVQLNPKFVSHPFWQTGKYVKEGSTPYF